MPNSTQQIRFDKITFICQITEDSFSLARCAGNENAKHITNLSVRPLAPSIGNNEISAKVRQALKDFGYRNSSFILCVPRSQATCRYLKIPAYLPHEIEKIISLQASTYLPYPAHELIIGYQVISVDREGYSYLNVVIVHKSLIERYLHIVREAGAEKISVVLSSYGLASLYNRLGHYDSGPVLLIACDSRQAELAVVGYKKLLFSRHVRLDGHPHGWEQELVAQVRQTREAYSEEVHGAVLHKVVILGKARDQESFFETLAKESVLPVEIIPYVEYLGVRGEAANVMAEFGGSLVGFFGLGWCKLPESLNLLTPEMKRQVTRLLFAREALGVSLSALAITGMVVLANANLVHYKTRYLKRLQRQIGALEADVKSLDELDRRLKVLDDRLHQKPTALDILYELHKVLPFDISLSSFGYEEGSRVILRGQARTLNAVVGLVAELGKAPVFKAFGIKVRYATAARGVQPAEAVDFELVGSKK